MICRVGARCRPTSPVGRAVPGMAADLRHNPLGNVDRVAPGFARDLRCAAGPHAFGKILQLGRDGVARLDRHLLDR